jgi:hypothetical protein
MYAIQACPDPEHIEVKLSGILDAGEMVRCISQASALAEAGSIRRVCADLSEAESCGLDQGLIIAALQARRLIDVKVAVVTSERMARISQRTLTRAGLDEDQARTFATNAEAIAWLGLGQTKSDLAATDRRHVNHVGMLIRDAKRKPVKKVRRKSVA